jgi:hypothetical protein
LKAMARRRALEGPTTAARPKQKWCHQLVGPDMLRGTAGWRGGELNQ